MTERMKIKLENAKQYEPRRKSPFLWLLIIPGKLVLDVLFCMLGIVLDILLWNWQYTQLSEEGQGGHGVIPIITAFFILFAAFLTLITIIVAVSCTCVSLYRQRKGR